MVQSGAQLEGGQRELNAVITRELVEKYISIKGDELDLTEQEKERYITMALVFQLNPFKREMHAVTQTEKGKRRFSVIVGYEVYLKKAERTGKLDGWRAWIDGAGESLKAVVEIHRNDWTHPFIHEVYWSEAVQQSEDGFVPEFWKRMPRFQLKKVAISQGFRLCFADEIGGMPYEWAELSLDSENSRSTIPHDKPHVPSKPPSPGLVESIHTLVLANTEILSPQHLVWIENQLRMEKTDAQLKGLLKHVEDCIAKGGDSPMGVNPKQTERPSGVRRVPNIRRMPKVQGEPSPPMKTGSALYKEDA